MTKSELMTSTSRHSAIWRLFCWMVRKCPDGHGCPPKLSNIIGKPDVYGGGGCGGRHANGGAGGNGPLIVSGGAGGGC